MASHRGIEKQAPRSLESRGIFYDIDVEWALNEAQVAALASIDRPTAN